MIKVANEWYPENSKEEEELLNGKTHKNFRSYLDDLHDDDWTRSKVIRPSKSEWRN